MAKAVQDSVVVQDLLEKSVAGGVPVIAPLIRDYPELMYLGLENPNRYDNGGKWTTQLTHAQKRSIPFKKIGALEGTMSVEKNSVEWYEIGMFQEKAEIQEDVAGATSVVIAPEQMKYFSEKDIVLIRPEVGSNGETAQAEITAIDKSSNTITLDTAVTADAGDTLVYAYPKIAECEEINKCAVDDDATPVKTYFQRFGGCVEFKMCDINVKRPFIDAKNYVGSRFSTVTNRANADFANAFYLGRNKPGSTSETQGLDHLIAEKETRDGEGTALINFNDLNITKADTRLEEMARIITDAHTAPVYKGNEGPTIFCNYNMINQLAADLREYRKGLGGFDLVENKICFGLPEFCSPYFKNAKFVVSHTLNKLEPNRSVCYMFPGHLVTFKYPEYLTPDASGSMIKNNVNGYSILKLPQTSVECVKYQMLMIIANVFGGQTFENSYKKVVNY